MLHECGVDVNSSTDAKMSAVFVACRYGHVNALKTLHELGANIHKPRSKGVTPLSLAIYNGHIDCIKALHSLGVDVHGCGMLGFTPFYLACRVGHVGAVQLLHSLNCDINTPDKDGVTPLLIACMQGHKDVVDILLSIGADVQCCVEREDVNVPMCSYVGEVVATHVGKLKITNYHATLAIFSLIRKVAFGLIYLDMEKLEEVLARRIGDGYANNIPTFIKNWSELEYMKQRKILSLCDFTLSSYYMVHNTHASPKGSQLLQENIACYYIDMLFTIFCHKERLLDLYNYRIICLSYDKESTLGPFLQLLDRNLIEKFICGEVSIALSTESIYKAMSICYYQVNSNISCWISLFLRCWERIKQYKIKYF